MSLFIPLIFVLALIFAANKAAGSSDPKAKRLFTWLMAVLNSSLIVLGVVFYFIPVELFSLQPEAGSAVINVLSISLIVIATGLWGILSCWQLFRAFLARFMPLDAGSPVHLTALVLAGYLASNTALALSQEFLQQLNPADLAVSVSDVVAQQSAFVLIALFGTGLFTRRDTAGIMNRLGLTRPTAGQLIIGFGVIFVLIVIQATIGAIWALLDPEQAAQLGSINEALLVGFDSIGKWFVLAAASGIGEETLFRGAIQPVFGLPLTALLFAIVHIQYGLTPITLAVFFLGLILGLVRRYTNTTVAIFIHFGYNFSLGLLSMLALYLQQFVTP